MCLDLLNYYDNLSLKLEIQGIKNTLDFARKHPIKIGKKIICSVFFRIIGRVRKDIDKKISKKAYIKPETAYVKYNWNIKKDQISNCYGRVYSIEYSKDEVGYKKLEIEIETKNTRLVIIHAYYEHEAHVIFDKICRYSGYDIILTTCNMKIAEKFFSVFKGNNVVCLNVRNLGRDILPFLLAIKFINLSKYQHFIKVHTKRSVHLNDGGKWFSSNLDFILPGEKILNKLYPLISSDKPSIFGKDVYPIQDHGEYNEFWLNYLLGKDYRAVEASFVPGTMFIGNGNFLTSLKQLGLDRLNYEEERGQLDGCLAHAIERFMGFLAKDRGGECESLQNFIRSHCAL